MEIGNYLEWAPMIAALAAVLALLWQINREVQSVLQKELEVKREAKMRIISDLVAYRFVLTASPSKHGGQEEALVFNTALSRTPVEFIEYNEVLRQYQELGNSFTAKKFHSLITAMLDAAGYRVPEHFTVELLENVPSR